MTFNLTPTELTALRDTGEARVVRVFENQPQQTFHDDRVWVYDGDLYIWGNPPMPSKEFVDAASPFPPAGTREVIDDIPCVWGEGVCRQADQVEMDLDRDGPTLCAEFLMKFKAGQWVWVGHIRKDTE